MALKNKLIRALLILLVLANIITIAMYWFSRKKPFSPPPQTQREQGPPSQFLIKELALDSIQQIKYLDLVKIHQSQTSDLREKTKVAKDHFFDLIKQPVLIDSVAKNNVSQISILTAKQDMATLQHFRQVRALCNPHQQQKFDSIIHQMLGIMTHQRPNMLLPDNGEKLQPSNDKIPRPFDGIHHYLPHRDGQMPPPPEDRMPMPPDGQHPPPDGKRPPPPNGDKPPPDGFPPPKQ